jgi:transcriptional regulator with XRE-family HTH domain
MAGPERLDGRDGQVWRAYVLGRSQEAIEGELGITKQRVSQILGEIRASIPAADRNDAALVDLERLDALLSGVMPAAVAGDTQAARAALAVLERRARMLRLDLDEPLRISFEKHLDDQGEMLADALGAALDAVPELSHEQRVAALTAAQAKLLGEEPPDRATVSNETDGELEVDAEQARREQQFRALMEADGVDADELLAEVDDEEEDGGV